jgi:hypothetical protein
MSTRPPWWLARDLIATFAFDLNGALSAVRAVQVGIPGTVAR